MKKIFLIIIMIFSFVNTFCQTKNLSYRDLWKGKTDSFSILKNKFRISMYDTSVRKIDLEKKVNGYWNVFAEFDDEYEFYDRTKDINNDGFPDIINYSNADFDCQVYLFNPILDTFIYSGFYSKEEIIPNGKKMIILDTKRNIYYDYCMERHREWYSCLFQIKDYRRIELGMIHLSIEHLYTPNGKHYETDTVYVEKNFGEINDITIKSVDVSKSSKKINYASYWKANWKNFLKD